jgi:MFS family permease
MIPGHMSTPLETVRRGVSPRAAVVLLLTINLFNYIDRYILAAVEPEIRQHFFGAGGAGGSAASAREELAASMAKTGSLATAFLVSYMLAAPLFGWLATRMSRWVLVAISVGVWSVASGASGLAGTFAILVLTRCFVGIGEAGYGPSAPSMISELYPVERRGSVLAWFYMAIPVGSALGYVMGGAVSKHLGWRWPFFLVVPPGLILAFCAYLMSRRAPVARAAQESGEHRKAGIKDYLAILKIPSYLFNTAGMAAMTFAIGGFSFWMPAYLKDEAHAGDLADVNFKFGAITAVTGVVATLAGGFLGDYFRRFTAGAYFIVSGIGILISAVFVLMVVHSVHSASAGHPNPVLWVWLALALFFLFLNTGPTNTALANVTRPAVRANAFALNILIIHALGDAISPPILGAVAGRSWDHALYLVAGVMVLAAVCWLAGAPFLKRDTDRAEQAAAVPPIVA